MNIIKKVIYSKYLFPILKYLDFNFYRYILVPIFYQRMYKTKLSKLNIKGKMNTAKLLASSNNSLSRFGDGELQWMLGNKHGSFEKNSPLLQKKLSQIIKVNDSNFMIALPDAFKSINQFNNRAKKLWGRFDIRYFNKIYPYLDKSIQYYDTSVVRPYIDYKNRRKAGNVFNELKKIWNNKNILIVEGNETRLGVGNNLFNNAKDIKRIECPVNNAFESYKAIYNNILKFLKASNKSYITLLSLGPTATILSYYIYKNGFRSIDIGHIDLEYCWYLMGVKKPVNLSYKYVNETNNNKNPTKNVHDSRYLNEIICKIK